MAYRDAGLAAKSSRPRTARPLTWPNQCDWSKDTRRRTADLAQVRSAAPTCSRTPRHQYGKYGERRDSMVSHECGKVVRYEQPTSPTIKAPAPTQGRGIAKRTIKLT
ncbi:hypothetical protein B296_00020691 [Ensete ventricosum]|uniref:Uncharacterized protein n=1 Tax=Ensete ventricosum TaxID=4639 RepID=A0A426ZN67_ENSVE|nr:hypothetical protein B296_00020691 [Ensete ventricosum]